MSVHNSVSLAEAADRLALRDLFDAYAHCADRRDALPPASAVTPTRGTSVSALGVFDSEL